MKICKIYIPFFWCTLLASFPKLASVETFNFQHVNQIIEQKTNLIATVEPWNRAALCDNYCSRGENYLLLQLYENALEDFRLAYDLADALDQPEREVSLIRSLFGQLISYGNLDNEKMTFMARDEIFFLLQALNCPSATSLIVLTNSPHAPIADWEPDSLPVNECLFRAKATAQAARALYNNNRTSAAIKEACEEVIRILLENAEGCCYRGLPWKTCLQLLINKWHDWFHNDIPKNVKDITLG